MRSGGLFDRDQERGRIIEAVAPVDGEAVIEKPLPNVFAGTNLAELADRFAIVAQGAGWYAAG